MNIRHSLFIALLLPLAACGQDAGKPSASGIASATSKPSAAAASVISKDDPRALLASKIPGSKPEDFRATPVPGIYELTHGNDISYVSADAKYVFAGDMYPCV